MIDFVRYNEAITVAMRVLDASGNARHASALRTDSPELMRLARIGKATHDAAGREPQPTAAVIPSTDAIARKE